MADFQVMGGVPDFYSQILNSARQQLVRQPDGTYAPAPQFGGSTSLDQIYGGILPPSVPKTPLVSRSVNTVPVDSNGNPIVPRVGNNIPSTRETLAEQRSGWRPAVTQGVQPAGTVTMPPGARPANIPLPTMPPPSTLSAAWDPFNTINENADQSRLPLNQGTEGIEAMQAFVSGQGANPAVAAIDQATGMPRPRPGFVQPFTPSPMLRNPLVPTGETLPGATNFDGSPVEITVRGGSKRNPPPVPMPRFVNNRGQAVTPQMGTFYNPDTNKFEQRQVFRPAPSGNGVPAVPLPRKRPPVNRGGSKNVSGPPVGMTVDEVGAFRYHG